MRYLVEPLTAIIGHEVINLNRYICYRYPVREWKRNETQWLCSTFPRDNSIAGSHAEELYMPAQSSGNGRVPVGEIDEALQRSD